MKQIIEVKLGTRRVEFVSCKTDMLVVGLFSDARVLDRPSAELDKKLDGAIGRVLKLGDFEGKSGSSAVVYGEGKIGARRVMLVGLGEKAKATLDTVRRAAMHAANRAAAMKVKNVALALHRALNGGLDAAAMGRVMAEGAYFGSFRYDEYVTGDENGRPDLLRVDIVEPDAKAIERLKDGIRCGAVIGRAQSYARMLANRPANVINPPLLAKEAQESVRGVKGLSCVVLDERQLAAKGMGGILAVGSGSQSKPRFIILKYTPAGGLGKNRLTVALVGKAITFDSGGISIKPATDMDQMKLDKTGGIAVLSVLKAAAELGLDLNVLGLIPAAENLPSGSSYRPGDIITTYSRKTVEILNTDAEGRMILCDALAYAVEQKCDVIVDIATLTGACMVALGTYMAGLMGNDDKLVEEIKRAAEESGEKVWPMPSGDEYAEEMKSKIADLRNTGGKWGGACTAAAFLKQFVGNARWAHLDIAGVDIFDKPTEYAGPGSTGFGVRLLTTYLMNLAVTKNSMG